MKKKLILAVAAAAALTGCSDELVCGEGTFAQGGKCVATLSPQCGPGTRLENGNCVPDEGGGAVCGPGTHSEGGTCVPDLERSGNAARFYDVNLVDPESIVGISNGPLHNSYLTGENLLFVGAYQPATSGLRLFGGPGTVAADGSYTLGRATAFDASTTLTGNLVTSAPFTLVLQAFGANDPFILLDSVITDGVLDSLDGYALLTSGKVSGVLTPENAQSVYVEAANLTFFELLQSIGTVPDVDHDGDGTKESWTFTLTFATTPVWLF